MIGPPSIAAGAAAGHRGLARLRATAPVRAAGRRRGQRGGPRRRAGRPAPLPARPRPPAAPGRPHRRPPARRPLAGLAHRPVQPLVRGRAQRPRIDRLAPCSSRCSAPRPGSCCCAGTAPWPWPSSASWPGAPGNAASWPPPWPEPGRARPADARPRWGRPAACPAAAARVVLLDRRAERSAARVPRDLPAVHGPRAVRRAGRAALLERPAARHAGRHARRPTAAGTAVIVAGDPQRARDARGRAGGPAAPGDPGVRADVRREQARAARSSTSCTRSSGPCWWTARCPRTPGPGWPATGTSATASVIRPPPGDPRTMTSRPWAEPGRLHPAGQHPAAPRPS